MLVFKNIVHISYELHTCRHIYIVNSKNHFSLKAVAGLLLKFSDSEESGYCTNDAFVAAGNYNVGKELSLIEPSNDTHCSFPENISEHFADVNINVKTEF